MRVLVLEAGNELPPSRSPVSRSEMGILKRGNAFPRWSTALLNPGNAFPRTMRGVIVPLMPRHAKATKLARDTQMIRGLRKHLAGEVLVLRGERMSTTQIVRELERHLHTMHESERTRVVWRAAVALEATLEKRVKALMPKLDLSIRMMFGERAILRDFGLKLRTRRRPSAETMRLAVEKRRATRAARGTMGKRQKAKIKAH
jgi:hypothetical protein